jgi:hypothetical protein
MAICYRQNVILFEMSRACVWPYAPYIGYIYSIFTIFVPYYLLCQRLKRAFRSQGPPLAHSKSG